MLIDYNWLYKDTYPLNNGLLLKHPTVQDVIDFENMPIYKSKEDGNVIKIFADSSDSIFENDFESFYFEGSKYTTLLNIFLTYPIDLIVELSDAGYDDYDAFSQYDIFMMLFKSRESLYKELIKFFLGDVELRVAINTETRENILYDKDRNIIFDLTSFMIMSNFIKAIQHISEDKSKTAKKSKALKKTILEVERANRAYYLEQQKKEKLSGKSERQLQRIITKLSVSSNYRSDELRNLRLYEFYGIVNEVISYNYWNFKMNGIHTGNIDTKKLNKKELDWFFN